MDAGWFGTMSFDWQFITALFSIFIIDLILAGDNAIVIAMAVRTLPQEEKKKGLLFGSGAAVILRIILTFFVAQLLQISFIKLVGGILILWIAVKLFMDGSHESQVDNQPTNLVQAIRVIVIADISMSVDNMLAVAAASHGNLFLLLFGLGLSIPFVLLTSSLLSMLMDRYPFIIWLGAAVLGRVGAEMIMTDPFVVNLLHPRDSVRYAVEASVAIGVIVVGKSWMKWGRRSGKEDRIPEDTKLSFGCPDDPEKKQGKQLRQ